MTTKDQTTTRLPKSTFRHAATVAATLALLASATAAHAGEIMLVNAFDQSISRLVTYQYTADGSGNFSASSRTTLAVNDYNGWVVDGPSTGTVPYKFGFQGTGLTKYTSTGAQPVQYTSGNNVVINPQMQAVESSSGTVYLRNDNRSNNYYGQFGIAAVTPSGAFSVVTTTQGNGLAIGPDGYLYQANWTQGSTGSIEKFSTSGTDLGQFAAYSGSTPTELAFDSNGNLFGLVNGTRLDEWSSTGTYMGTFKSGLPATLVCCSNAPNTFAIDSNDNFWWSQGAGSLYKITPGGTVSTFDFSSSGIQARSVAILDTGNAAPEPSTGLLIAGTGLLLAGRSRKLAQRLNKSGL